MKKTLGIVLAVGLAASGAARAVELLEIDINALSASYVGTPFGLNATGTITLIQDGNSVLNGIAIDGAAQAYTGALTSFTGTINLVNGFVTGGSFAETNNDATSFSCSVLGGFGQVAFQAGQGFQIDGLTFNNLFSGPLFAGANIAPFFNSQPNFGATLTFKFNPNAKGIDRDTDIDISVFIPTPMAAGMGFAGLLGVGSVRRRR